MPVTESTAGNIIAMSGIPDITIGDTICAPDCVEALPFVKISAPTLEMTFSVNDSPFAGKEGKFVTSRQLRDRLYRETLKDVSLRVTDTDKETAFNVAGRGEMSLSILIETMRREGYEFQVSPARVLYQEIDGVKCEPIERLVVDVPGDCVGAVIEKLGARKARSGGDDSRGRPDEDRVPDSRPGPLRLPQRFPDGHQGRGHHGQRVRLLRPLQGRHLPPGHRLHDLL